MFALVTWLTVAVALSFLAAYRWEPPKPRTVYVPVDAPPVQAPAGLGRVWFE